MNNPYPPLNLQFIAFKSEVDLIKSLAFISKLGNSLYCHNAAQLSGSLDLQYRKVKICFFTPVRLVPCSELLIIYIFRKCLFFLLSLYFTHFLLHTFPTLEHLLVTCDGELKLYPGCLSSCQTRY